MRKKCTPWFPISIKPVHAGWYDVRDEYHARIRCYWTGKRWTATHLKWFYKEWRGAVAP